MLQDRIRRSLSTPDRDDVSMEAHDDIREIEALLVRFEEALSRSDVEGIRAVYSEDAVCVFTGSAGCVRGLPGVLETWRKHLGDWEDVSVIRSDTRVRIHADTAWTTFTLSGSGISDGRRFDVSGERWSAVLMWEEGAWRFAQTHSSLPFEDWSALEVSL